MKKFGLLFILLAILFISGYVYWFYLNSYSSGYREGVLFKFSKKGNIFKTDEGEMIQPGLRSIQQGSINTNNFYFSVADNQLADTLNRVIGKNIKVHYTQYRKALPWRGENYNGKNSENGQYIVDKIDKITEAPTQIGF